MTTLCVALALTLAQEETVWLDELDLSGITQEWGEPRPRRSVEGRPLRIGAEAFLRGIGTHARSAFDVDLKRAVARFEARVGVDSEVQDDRASIVFEVHVDGKLAYESGAMKRQDKAKSVRVDVTDAKFMRLIVTDAGDSNWYDHADWGDAKLVLVAGAKERPVAAIIPRGPEVILTPEPPAVPRLNGPRVYGARPGRPFAYTVPATGEEPIRFSAEDLPEGLELDEATGSVTGWVEKRGAHKVRVTATNAKGSCTRIFEIVIGDAIALTPPMGWNSWNCWGTAVDDAKIRAAADALVTTGLAKHGWTYVNIDDAWEGTRDGKGVIRPNEKFPDMKALADYVHAKGLKIGIYSSPGPKTCQDYEGSLGHEEQDARTFAEWGFDYLKYDWCSCQSKDLKEPYRIMRSALDKVDRDIVYSLCQYGMGDVWEWGAQVGGTCWRTTGDIVDTWPSMSGIGFRQTGLEKHAGPGRWNDPDMLVVGMVGWGPNLRPTRLTPDEQVTHLTLWCMLAAPLLIGCDLTRMSEFTLSLLTNEEVLAVDQDALGRQGWRVKREGELEVWKKPLFDGTTAVALFNLGFEAAEVGVSWKELEIEGAQPVRDLWRQKDLGKRADVFTARVAPHGTVLVRVGE